jgi:predicted glycosyltransferase
MNLSPTTPSATKPGGKTLGIQPAHDGCPLSQAQLSGGAPASIRIACYSHDTLGLGHIRRNLLIAQTLADSPLRATILVLAGAREGAVFPLPPGVDSATLPSLQKNDDGEYVPRRLRVTLRQVVGLRAHIIQGALEAFSPDVLIADTEPRGAFRELEPALSWLRMQGRTHCVLGLRDVRDHPLVVQREWRKASNDAAIRDYYDQVWVYGDPRVIDAVAGYGMTDEIAGRVKYTGYLDQRARLRFVREGDDGPRLLASLPPGRLMLCTVGGGQDGAAIARAFIEADFPDDSLGLVLAGPQMPPDTLDELRWRAVSSGRVRILRFLPEPAPLLEKADRLVTMGGYNSTLEAVSYGRPALIVPRVTPRQEQWIRATRLRELGLIDVLHPTELSPAAISAWLRSEQPARQPDELIDLGGLSRVVRFLSVVGHEQHEVREAS